MLYGLACLDAASEAFINGEINKCQEYCKKADSCVFTLGELSEGKLIKRQVDLYRFLCQPILTEEGEEYRSTKMNNMNSDNFISRTFDENGICRHNIIEAYRALRREETQEALKCLREVEVYIENFEHHPYKKELYKLFEMAYLQNEDYKNAHLYRSKILALYSEHGKK